MSQILATRLQLKSLLAFPDLPNNTAGDVVGNTGRITYTGGQAQEFRGIDIVEPDLEIVKTPSTTTADAGDIITYTIDIDHASGSSATAFDLSIIDLINDPNLNLIGGTLALSGTGAAFATIVDGDMAGDPTLSVGVSELGLTDTLRITFDAQIVGTAGFGVDIDNTVSLDYSSAPGPTATERDYSVSDDATVSVDGALITKSVISTSETASGSSQGDPAAPDLVIGETVTFEIVVTLPEGTGPVTITDQLPLGAGVLSYVSGEIVSIGSNISGSTLSVGAIPGASVSDSNSDTFDDQVSLNFGNLTVAANGTAQGSDDQIVVRITALVEDTPSNANGDAISNAADVDYGTGNEGAIAPVDIIEPELVIDKARDVADPDAGDTVTFTVTLDHTAASSADAQDVVIHRSHSFGAFTGGRLGQCHWPWRCDDGQHSGRCERRCDSRFAWPDPGRHRDVRSNS